MWKGSASRWPQMLELWALVGLHEPAAPREGWSSSLGHLVLGVSIPEGSCLAWGTGLLRTHVLASPVKSSV